MEKWYLKMTSCKLTYTRCHEIIAAYSAAKDEFESNAHLILPSSSVSMIFPQLIAGCTREKAACFQGKRWNILIYLADWITDAKCIDCFCFSFKEFNPLIKRLIWYSYSKLQGFMCPNRECRDAMSGFEGKDTKLPWKREKEKYHSHTLQNKKMKYLNWTF